MLILQMVDEGLQERFRNFEAGREKRQEITLYYCITVRSTHGVSFCSRKRVGGYAAINTRLKRRKGRTHNTCMMMITEHDDTDRKVPSPVRSVYSEV